MRWNRSWHSVPQALVMRQFRPMEIKTRGTKNNET